MSEGNAAPAPEATPVAGEQVDATTTGDATGAEQTAETVTFSTEQQEHIDALLGRTRQEARTRVQAEVEKQQAKAKVEAETEQLKAEKKWQALAGQHEERIATLEPLEARVTAYQETITGMLDAKVTALGDKAKTAIDGLPEGMDALAKLTWLNDNTDLFAQRAGTPSIDATTHNVDTTPAEVTDAEVADIAARLNVRPEYVDRKDVLQARQLAAASRG